MNNNHDEHMNSPESYIRAGNYANDRTQPMTDKPLTCREREYLLDEIDHWQRAYYIACDRRDRDKLDNTECHRKIVDFIVFGMFIVIAICVMSHMFMTIVDWMLYGWR